MFSNISTYLLQNDPWNTYGSTGVDRRRVLPNNRLQDPAGIPDFHPQIHLNNDAGKLSRFMVATHKYKGNL
jgi:hypothetical protein